MVSEVVGTWAYTQNPTSLDWLQSLLLLSRFGTIKKHDEIKYLYLIILIMSSSPVYKTQC